MGLPFSPGVCGSPSSCWQNFFPCGCWTQVTGSLQAMVWGLLRALAGAPPHGQFAARMLAFSQAGVWKFLTSPSAASGRKLCFLKDSCGYIISLILIISVF